MEFKLSDHIKDVLKERNIHQEWVWGTVNAPDWENVGIDNNIHYFKKYH
jgi:hypothetical protein